MLEVDDEFGLHYGECVGCDMFFHIDEQGLCADCAGQLERDLIRERAWAYSVFAHGLSDHQREDLRRQVIRKYGKDMELIARKLGRFPGISIFCRSPFAVDGR